MAVVVPRTSEKMACSSSLDLRNSLRPWGSKLVGPRPHHR